jgi:uncharacterized protein YodC (DUF2158 family)
MSLNPEERKMSSFNKGDQVKLKSGGPVMTVQSIGDYSPMGPENGVSCTWFDGAKKRQEDVFDEAILDKV